MRTRAMDGLIIAAALALALVLILWPWTASAHDGPFVPVNTEDSDPIAEAVREAAAQQKSLIIYLSTATCEPCREVAKRYLPQIRKRGVFLHLDLDKHESLCRYYRYYGPVPRLIVFEYHRGRWGAPRVVVGMYAIGRFVGERP